MGHKKRQSGSGRQGKNQWRLPSPAPFSQDSSVSGKSAISDDKAEDSNSRITTFQCDDSVKVDYLRAVAAFHRGNHAKALRLVKEACSRHEDSGTLHRLQGSICLAIAATNNDPNSRHKHLKIALDSAKKAVTLSQNSIEFAFFYANLLYNVRDDFDEVRNECDRALSIANPIDPDIETFQEHVDISGMKRRIDEVKENLQSLKRRLNSSSISSPEKEKFHRGNDKKLQLISGRQHISDLTRIRTSRPKQEAKTDEAVRVSELLHHKWKSIESKSYDATENEPIPKVKKRRGVGKGYMTSVVEKLRKVSRLWKSMNAKQKKQLLKIDICDLEEHVREYIGGKASAILLEAISYAMDKKTWKIWPCTLCNEKPQSSILFMQHLIKHADDFPKDLNCFIPEPVDENCIKMIRSIVWKPIDALAAVKITRHRFRQQKSCQPSDYNTSVKPSELENTCGVGCTLWEYRAAGFNKKNDAFVNGEEDDRGNVGSKHVSGDMESGYPGADDNDFKWPLADDPKRSELLQKIYSTLESLIEYKCLTKSAIRMLIRHSMTRLAATAPLPELLVCGINQSLICLCFLGHQDLNEIILHLSNLSAACGLIWYSSMIQKETSLRKVDIKLRICFTDDLSSLLLDEHVFQKESSSDTCCGTAADEDNASTISTDHHVHPECDDNVFLAWLFSEASIVEVQEIWNNLIDLQKMHASKILVRLNDIFRDLKSFCGQKSVQIKYADALSEIGNIWNEELEKRQNEEYVPRALATVLTELVKEVEQGNDDVTYKKIRLDSLQVLLEHIMTKVEPSPKTVNNVTSNPCSNDSGEQNENKIQDCLQAPAVEIEAVNLRIKMSADEIFETDKKIMHCIISKNYMEQKMGWMCSVDYRTIMLAFLKSYLQEKLENLADKDAFEKSQAACEALLSEINHDTKKNMHAQQVQKKSPAKKKNKRSERRKALKDRKETNKEPDEISKSPIEMEDETVQMPWAVQENELTETLSEKLEDDVLSLHKDNSGSGSICITAHCNAKVESLRIDADGINHEILPQANIDMVMELDFPAFCQDTSDNSIEEGDFQKLDRSQITTQDLLDQGVQDGNDILNQTIEYMRSQKIFDDLTNTEANNTQQGDEYSLSLEDAWASSEASQVQQELPMTKQDPPKSFHQYPVYIQFGSINRSAVFETGLRNDIGEYNCFLNVIIQSLWHIRMFRVKFLGSTIPVHEHVSDPCVVCALYEVFASMNIATEEAKTETLSPTSLRIALSKLHPTGNLFQEAQMNNASEMLLEILNCLHSTSAPQLTVSTPESEQTKCQNYLKCESTDCLAHTIFGMDFSERMQCRNCGLESRFFQYKALSYDINAGILRNLKRTHRESPLDKLVNMVEMNHKLCCDPEDGGCRSHNQIQRTIFRRPHVFTAVLGWGTSSEKSEDISDTIDALSMEIDTSVMFEGIESARRHRLISMVCYQGQHYVCFALVHEHEWLKYDDKVVKDVGSWNDVLAMCKRGHLQPHVLYFEDVQKILP